jgi:hypothetical protein
MIFPVKWALWWFLRKSGSLENGTPTPLAMVIILMIVFFSAFMTDILGVHAIFGGAWYSMPLFSPSTEYGTGRLHRRPYHPARERLRYLPDREARRFRHFVTDSHRTSTLSASFAWGGLDPSQYFALSGLKTNLGLLNDGITWGYVILLCVVAFVGKFVGCAVAARACKFDLRESSAIGVLMSCKGYVPPLANA